MKWPLHFGVWALIGALVVYTLSLNGLITPALSQNVLMETGTQNVRADSAVEIQEYIQRFSAVYDLLEQNYYETEKLDKVAMRENAIKWFVDAIGDPYTAYLTPEENKLFDEEMDGEQKFEWIGAVVRKKEDGVLIEEVLKWSPAHTAGLESLDVILKIDWEVTQSLDLDEAVAKIRGVKWTSVVLTILRAKEEVSIFDVTVTRDVVNVHSVEMQTMEFSGKNMLYVNVSIFGDDTIKTFLQELRNHPVRDGVIIDVRGNGGGYLPVAVELASFFVPKSKIVTTSKYRIYDDEEYVSEGYPELQDIPVIILVDELSASASEIVAAAAQFYKKGSVVGKQTFGKGSIQTLDAIENGGSLKYTLGKRYTPDGWNIDGVGITPDIEIDFDAEAFQASGVDTQLDGAKQELFRLLQN